MREGIKMAELREIPTTWNIVHLRDVIINLISGVSVNSEDREALKGEFGILKTSSISNGKFYPKYHKTIIDSDIQKARLNPKADTILISRMNTPSLVGESGYVDKDYLDLYLPDRIWMTEKVNLEIVQTKWLSHVLSSPVMKEKIAMIATGTSNSMKNISKPSFLNLSILLPSVAEQKKIAEILTTVDEKIEVIETQINQTQELKKGLMQQLLTKGIGYTKFKESSLGEIPENWEVVKLDTLVEKVGSGITPKGGQESYVQEGILFIRSQNVLSGKLKLADVAYISTEQHEKMQGSKLVVGDVLLNITGASIGRSAVVPESITEGNVNQHVCIIRTRGSLNNNFLCQLLNSNYGQNQIDKFQAGGNREGLNFQQIRSFDIPFPQLNEQENIASILNTVDEKLEVLLAKKDTFTEMKKGLMQQLLTGKIRVKIN